MQAMSMHYTRRSLINFLTLFTVAASTLCAADKPAADKAAAKKPAPPVVQPEEVVHPSLRRVAQGQRATADRLEKR